VVNLAVLPFVVYLLQDQARSKVPQVQRTKSHRIDYFFLSFTKLSYFDLPTTTIIFAGSTEECLTCQLNLGTGMEDDKLQVAETFTDIANFGYQNICLI